MTEDLHFKWSSEPLCICLYLGLSPRPLCSKAGVLPTRPQWQVLKEVSILNCNHESNKSRVVIDTSGLLFIKNLKPSLKLTILKSQFQTQTQSYISIKANLAFLIEILHKYYIVKII